MGTPKMPGEPPRVQPSTVYGQTIRFYGEWLVAQGRPATLEELSRAAVREWLAQLTESNELSTVRTRHKGLQGFCGWLVAEGLIAANPMSGLEAPSAHAKPMPSSTGSGRRSLRTRTPSTGPAPGEPAPQDDGGQHRTGRRLSPRRALRRTYRFQVLILRAPEQETVMHFVTKHQDGRDPVTGARVAKPAYVFGVLGEPGTYIICTDCADPEHLAVIRTLASTADPPAA